MPSHTLTVTEDHHQERLDIFLAKNVPDIPSRTWAKHLIEEGFVTVDHKQAKAHHKVKTGNEVRVQILDLPGVPDIEPENIPLDIFYEDDSLAVIYKPAGMLVHPTNTCRTQTLVNALLYHYRELSSVNEAFRPGIVHRLDRETSGLMLIAKDNRTHIRLAREFEKHRVHKKYVALVRGRVEFEEGVIDAALDRDPQHFDKRSVAYHQDAQAAKTFYRVMRRLDSHATLVGLYPRTGRTHQLRVHMAHLGHPILGDDKYGQANSFGRLALHAQSIGFRHPQTKHFVEFSIPFPSEFTVG